MHDPDGEADDDRARGEDGAARRQVDADRVEQRLQPLGEPEPHEHARHRGERPHDEGLEHDRPEHLPARRAERAQRRELTRALGDRDGQRVGDHEAADDQRDAAEGEQEVAEVRHPVACFLGPGLALRGGRLDMSGGGQQRPDALDQLARGDALARSHLDLVELSGLVEQPLGGAQLEGRDLRAPERLDRPVLDDAGDAELPHGAERADADRVARLQVLLPCGRAVDGDLLATSRPASLHDGERVEARVGSGVDGERRGAPAALDHLPVLADEPGFVEHRPVGALHLRERADLRQDAGRVALGRDLFVLAEALLADDDRVGVRVGLREDRVEALRDRVGEDVGAAHHRDAEDDGQRGEGGAELASRPGP